MMNKKKKKYISNYKQLLTMESNNNNALGGSIGIKLKCMTMHKAGGGDGIKINTLPLSEKW